MTFEVLASLSFLSIFLIVAKSFLSREITIFIVSPSDVRGMPGTKKLEGASVHQMSMNIVPIFLGTSYMWGSVQRPSEAPSHVCSAALHL
jgi:hypothetical protein